MWIWRFYLPHQYTKVEQWLSGMASQGWRLVEHRRFRFRFEQHEPKTRGYLYMFGGSRENDIMSVVRELEAGCHALEIPCGRFTLSTLLMLPDPEVLTEVPALMHERRTEHLKCFLLWAFAWLVIPSPIQAALAQMDSPLRWLGHGLLALPAMVYLYAAWKEAWRQ